MRAKYFDGRPSYHRSMVNVSLKHVYLTSEEKRSEKLYPNKSEFVQEEDGKIYKLTNGYYGFVKEA